jgi:hypothetical protein
MLFVTNVRIVHYTQKYTILKHYTIRRNKYTFLYSALFGALFNRYLQHHIRTGNHTIMDSALFKGLVHYTKYYPKHHSASDTGGRLRGPFRS